ncbi:MAG: zinc ribbon domain-containing protein [Oscillospiraceae bacterium]
MKNMVCPRCGRQVNDNANFCGGCGLSKKEIDAQVAQKAAYTYTEPVFEKAPEKTGEVQNFVEQPFPTDVEFKDVPSDTVDPEVQATTQQSASQQSASQYCAPQQQYPAPNMQPEKLKDNGLATVDFVWMMIFTSIPFFGLLYLIYLSFVQDGNTTKRSYARAVLILRGFALAIGVMFIVGFMMVGIY